VAVAEPLMWRTDRPFALSNLHSSEIIAVAAGAVGMSHGSIVWSFRCAFRGEMAKEWLPTLQNNATSDGGAAHVKDGCHLATRGVLRFDGNAALKGRGGESRSR
jgi:hypothetical protein